MIERYTRKEMAVLWSPEAKFEKWLEVELAVCKAWAAQGKIPQKALRTIQKKARFNVKRIDAIEKVVKHDVIAFLSNVAEHVGPSSRYIHRGMTSSDVLDTAFSLQLRDASDLLLKDLKGLMVVLRKKAVSTQNIPMIGRSHGMHAEPITFGLKLAGWYEELKRDLERLKRARDRVNVAKISGAVGTYAHLSPVLEASICRTLKMRPALGSTQVIARDHYAEFFTTLAILAASLERFATEIRHLQRSEVGEVEEFFSKGQKGSSAMPHKRNPIISENLCGLARLVRGYALTAIENVALWHERDISHSSVERVIGPDSAILLDTMLTKMTILIDQLVIYPERMKANMEKSRGLFFSEGVLLSIINAGLTREKAYKMVQRNAMQAIERGQDFRELLQRDPEIEQYLDAKALDACFDLKKALRHVDAIFRKVFG